MKQEKKMKDGEYPLLREPPRDTMIPNMNDYDVNRLDNRISVDSNIQLMNIPGYNGLHIESIE